MDILWNIFAMIGLVTVGATIGVMVFSLLIMSRTNDDRP